jgi:quercetin dioxygenase-like cupin family protein
MVQPNAELFDFNEPGAGQKAGFGKWTTPKSPYDLFMESQGIPIHRDVGVRKIQDLPMGDWKRLGGRGTAIQLLGTEHLWGMYVVEVPGAGALNPERHLYEEIYYVVEGRGSTEVWQDKDPQKVVSFEWGPGSLFGIPLNAWHRVVNSSSSPAMLLAATTAPNIVNLVRDPDFVLNCPYDFTTRFDPDAEDYFKPVEEVYADPIRGLAMRRTNVIPDIVNCELPQDNRRSFSYRRVEPHMAGANFYMKIGEYENGQYSKAHKHSSGAILVCIKGEGYSYTWPDKLGQQPWQGERGDQVKMQPYEPVGMISAAPMTGDWFHQHFGTSPGGIRFLIFDGPYGPAYRRGGAPGSNAMDAGAVDTRDGGNAISYVDEDPQIRATYAEELAEKGAESQMPEWAYTHQTPPPGSAPIGGGA